MNKEKTEVRRERAADLFREGYNCAQSVVLAFSDLIEVENGMNEQALAKLASSFGGGMGRLREVCGAVSGMFLVLGMLCGYDSPSDTVGKTKQYKEIQALAREFQELHGSVVCRDILKKPAGAEHFIPAERTEAYYQSRPCESCVADAAEIMENFLKKMK